MKLANTFDANLLQNTADMSLDYTARESDPKRTFLDDSSRASRMTKLPGLVIKGSGNEEQPLNMSSRTLRKITTTGYALSPKLIR